MTSAGTLRMSYQIPKERELALLSRPLYKWVDASHQIFLYGDRGGEDYYGRNKEGREQGRAK